MRFRELRLILGCLFCWVFVLCLTLGYWDSRTYITTVISRFPEHEFWVVSERKRIGLRYESPGRAAERCFFVDRDLCQRSVDFRTTSIGSVGKGGEISFPSEWGTPAPDHMRPARRYSFSFPYWIAIVVALSSAVGLSYRIFRIRSLGH
jgi:hypothetical protein